MEASGVGGGGCVGVGCGSFRVDMNLEIFCTGQIEFVMFFEDLAGAIESVLEPKTGSGKAMSGGSCDAIVYGVAFLEAEDSHGFDANVVIGREVGDEFAGGVGDGAGKEFGGAAGGVADADEWNVDLLEVAVVFEVEVREFARAQ